MKILIDTNVILDSLASRKPHNKNADDIFDLIAKNHVEAYLNTSSVTDIYYILRKTLGDTALPDFEDALVVVCAEKVNLDYIVTRDEGRASSASQCRFPN